jgi:hypothetical protein
MINVWEHSMFILIQTLWNIQMYQMLHGSPLMCRTFMLYQSVKNKLKISKVTKNQYQKISALKQRMCLLRFWTIALSVPLQFTLETELVTKRFEVVSY